jgi:predicted nucleic acid-binding protein
VSLVDWTSFELMRRQGIERAFALDADFDRQGFATVP